tara:strand:+ start:623 stop:880 length:258 start_codon:yes stop_codon:yes gene_type:complete
MKQINIERVNKYGEHQHYLGTQGKDLVPFEEWASEPITEQKVSWNREEVIELINSALGDVDTSNLEIGNSVIFPTIDDKWFEVNI